jgi:OmcA/MtrC family decaheme c-type cytochrome
VCVVCHNPNATDRAGRIKAGVAGEQAIDFKVQSHAMHAGQADKGGFRTTGITIYGADDGSPTDFSSVVFPGKLNICTNCHTDTGYQLTGVWATPTASGILGTTVSSGASTTDATDNLRNSPTTAVCTSCHDDALTKTHVLANGGIFSATQAAIKAAAEEGCSLCHGPGRVVDVKTVHGVP